MVFPLLEMKALARLCVCTCSPDPSLVVAAIGTKLSCCQIYYIYTGINYFTKALLLPTYMMIVAL